MHRKGLQTTVLLPLNKAVEVFSGDLFNVALSGSCDKGQEKLNGRTAASHRIGPATSPVLIPQIPLSILPAHKLRFRELVQ
ncbi:MAG: hypothetical protein ACK2U1_23475 [Anaerolineales bacterium]